MCSPTNEGAEHDKRTARSSNTKPRSGETTAHLNQVEYKIVLDHFEHKDISKNKIFLYYNKFFNNLIVKQDIFFKEYTNNISFINPKIYDKNTTNNLNTILEEINFNKN